MKKYLAAGLLMMIPFLAHAQSQVVADVLIDWDMPKTRENGAVLAETDLAKLVIYTVGGTSAKPTYTKKAEVLPDSAGKFPASATMTEVSGRAVYVMTAVDKTGLESKYSNQVIMTIDIATLSVPGAPAIRGRVVFRIK